MFSRTILASLTLVSAAATLQAQATTRPGEEVFTRAQELVSDGNSAAGRALIDSMVKATPATSPLYPQALFWRATLALNAADAERDYKYIVVEYPLAPQAEDALLRLAQLELARGDRDDALVHLRRMQRDYPRSKSLARASYWIARVLFEKNDITTACAANATALAQTTAAEVELRNQIEYQSQRCAAHAARIAAAADSAADTTRRASDSQPTVIEPKTPVKPAPSVPTAAPAASTPGSGFSVQVAAYNRQADADALVASLLRRGYEARVDGSTAPFRVRIGRYATAKEAETALREIKAKKMEGFVVRAPSR